MEPLLTRARAAARLTMSVDRRDENSRFVRRTLIVLGLLSLFGLVGVVLWYAAIVPLLFFAGVLLAILIDLPVRWLMRRTGMRRAWAAGLVLLLFVGLMVGVVGWAGPGLAGQAEELSRKLPESADQLRSQLERTSWGRTLLRYVPQRPREVLPSASEALGRVTGAFSTLIWAATATLVILFTGIFLAFEPRLYVTGALHLAPPTRRARAREVLGAITHALRWWLAGRLASMAVDGVLIAAGLWLMGIPLALILGLLAALLAFIPNIGPILAFVPAGLIAFVQGPMTVLWVGLLYLGVQTVESYMITPLIEKKAVSLPPAVLLSVQVLMGLLGGAIGLLVASPLAVVVIVLVQTLYVQDVLGERVEVLGEDHG